LGVSAIFWEQVKPGVVAISLGGYPQRCSYPRLSTCHFPNSPVDQTGIGVVFLLLIVAKQSICPACVMGFWFYLPFS
jgi:hypothetical protein